MKKVVLVDVAPNQETITINALPSLGLGYIAASLEHFGFDVSIVDSVIYGSSLDAAADLIINSRPDAVGYTATSSARFNAAKLIKNVKTKTGAFTFVGGAHFSPTANEALRQIKEIDVVVLGEGEETTVELLNCYGNGNDFSRIEGVCFRSSNNQIMSTGLRDGPDLDALPMPAYHLFRLEKYNYKFFGAREKCIGLMSSRGCPNQCIFCATLGKKKIRLRNPSNFVDEVVYLLKNYGYKSFDFWDDTMTMVRSHVENICNEILRRGLKIEWAARGRVDTVDKKILSLMKEAGCVSIAFGIESGSQRVLNTMGKNISLTQANEAVRMASQLGFFVENFFIVNMPQETLEDINLTLDLMLKYERYKNVRNTYCFAMVYPGTELEEIANRSSGNRFDWYKPFYSQKNNLIGNDPFTPCFEQRNLTVEEIKLFIFKRYSLLYKIKKAFKKIRKIKNITLLIKSMVIFSMSIFSWRKFNKPDFMPKASTFEKTAKLYGYIFNNMNDNEFLSKSENYFKRFKIETSWFKNKLCLDAGCGAGIGTHALAEIGKAKVVSFDIGDECLNIARNRTLLTKNVSFLKANVEAEPFKQDAFDFINCNGVLHHIEFFNESISELYRVLKPGGFLFIGVYGKGGILNQYKIDLFRFLAKNVPLRIMGFVLPKKKRSELLDNFYVPIRRSFSEKFIREHIEFAGFVKIKRLGEGFYRVPISKLEKIKLGRDGMYMHFIIQK